MTRELTSREIAALSGPLAVLRACPRLLVFDFDGTLAPLAPTPRAARLPKATRAALRRLAARKDGAVAVLSGRTLASLRPLLPPGVPMSGEHGLAADGSAWALPPRLLAVPRRALRARRRALLALASGCPGSLVEFKDFGVAVHVRGVRDPRRAQGLWEAARVLFRGSGLRAMAGKDVLEFVPTAGKGKAGGLRRLARALAPGWRRRGSGLFVGDDRTDEDAFRAAASWGPRFLCVKVGPGATAAPWRIAERGGVDGLVRSLAEC